MRKWRDKSILDLYNFISRCCCLFTPWFFAHRNATAVIDLHAQKRRGNRDHIAGGNVCRRLLGGMDQPPGRGLAESFHRGSSAFTHTGAMTFSIAVGAAVAFLATLRVCG